MTHFDSNLSLGQYLRQERERRGITIEQVASATKIGVRTLHALESDQYAELPAKPFIRGFVTSYSRFIGLDHKEVLTHFNSFMDGKVHERPNREAGHSGYAFEKREGGDQSRMILGIVMGSFIVLGGIAMVVLKPSLHKHHHSHVDKLRADHPGSPVPEGSPSEVLAAVGSEPSPHASVVSPAPTPSVAIPSPTPSVAASAAAPKPSPQPSPKPSPKPSPSVSPSPTTAANDPLNSGLGLKPSETAQRVVVKATESAWVRYRVDDKPMMMFPLRKGKVLVLRARQNIVLQTNNPADLQISPNGAGYRSATTVSSTERQGDVTFFFPPQIAENIKEPFPGSKPLAEKRVPSSPSSQATPLSH